MVTPTPTSKDFRAATSDLLFRSALATLAGVTFEGARDLYEALGYTRRLTPKKFRQRYERNGIAARVVDAYPRATWRGGAELIEDDQEDVLTPFEEAWAAMQTRLQVWSVFLRADILAGLGRYAVILIGAPGRFEEPLGTDLTADAISYLQPFSEEDATVDAFVEDESDPRFGEPLMYAFRRIGSAKKNAISRRVHWSRVIHVADGTLDDRVYGTARMAPVWNFLDDLEKVAGGGAEAFFRRAHQGMHLNLSPDVTPPEGATLATMEEKADEFALGFRRTLATQGMDVRMLGSDVANFNNPIDAILTLIAGSTGIPKRILIGSERGELSSAQDKIAWDISVTDRRTEFAFPVVIKPYVDRIVACGALPKPERFAAVWPALGSLDEPEKADVAAKWAALNKAAGGVVVLRREIRGRILQLDPLTPREIAEEEKADTAEAASDDGSRDDEERVSVEEKEEDGEEGEDENGSGAVRAASALPNGRVRRVADADVGRWTHAIRHAMRIAERSVDMSALTAAIEDRNEAAARQILGKAEAIFDASLRSLLPKHVLGTLTRSGIVASREFR